ALTRGCRCGTCRGSRRGRRPRGLNAYEGHSTRGKLGPVIVATLLAASWLARPAAAQSGWPAYGGDSANTRYSPLSRINTSTVNRLKVAWVLQFGSLEAQESTPVVVGDTLYVTTSAGPRYVYAVNAKTGAIRWKYAPEIPPDVQQTTGCGLDN